MTSGERVGQSVLSTGLSAVSTGVGIGAYFGPLGAAIGGTVGGLVGLTSALNAAKLTSEELMQLNEQIVQKQQSNIAASSSYIEAQKSLADMVAKGASSTEIENASKKLSDNFKRIEDVKLQEIFNATGGDVKRMTEELQKYTNESNRKSAALRGLVGKSSFADTASALNAGFNKEQRDSFITGLKNTILPQKAEEKKNTGNAFQQGNAFVGDSMLLGVQSQIAYFSSALKLPAVSTFTPSLT